MSIIREKISTKYEREVHVRTICDCCKRDTVMEDNWAKNSYDTSRVRVSLREGSSCSEGGSWEQIGYIICDQCFEKHIIPLMDSLGVIATKTDCDW